MASWSCLNCRETIQGDWDICWNCGTDRAGIDDPDFQPAVGFTPQCQWCGYLLYGA